MQKPKKPDLPQKGAFLNPIQSQNDVLPALNEQRLFNLWLYHGNTPETFTVDKAQALSVRLSRQDLEKRNAMIAKYESELAKYEEEKRQININAFEKLFEFNIFDGITFLEKRWVEKIVYEEKDKSGSVLWRLTTTPRELLQIKGTHDAIAQLPDVRDNRQGFKHQALALYNEHRFNVEVFQNGKSHIFYCMLKFRL